MHSQAQRLLLVLVAIVILARAETAQARVFNYKDAGLAAYVRSTGGFSALDQDQFANSDGGATVSGASKFQYSGELGAMFGLGPVQLRLGAEVIQHRPVSNNEGTNAAGTSLFTLDSSVFVFNPCATLEYVYSGSGSLRYYAALGLGYANVTVVNSYKMTTAGSAANNNITDFDEKMDANVVSGHAELGLETLFTDNVTFLAGIGYRYLPVRELRYKGDVNTILAPAGVTKGEVALNEDGSKRTMNLGGIFASVGFRFYLNFM